MRNYFTIRIKRNFQYYILGKFFMRNEKQMFANNMKILTSNTNNALPISVQNDSGSQPVNNKIINSSDNAKIGSSERASSGDPTNRTNKRDQKHGNKNKFGHGNINKIQQHIQQHQELQKHHNKNNNIGSKLKSQHYGNVNNGNNHNTPSSVNRKKYYQQQPQQHQQKHQQHYQQQQYQKSISSLQNNTNITMTVNNNNSNLVKNQNYNNTDLQQQQQTNQPQQQQKQNIVNNLEHFSTDLSEKRACFSQQDNNCDKLVQTSFPPDCSSSVLTVKINHCPLNYNDNRLKLSTSNDEVVKSSSTAANDSSSCASCWKIFNKSPEKVSKSFETNIVNALVTNCDTNENLPKKTSSSASQTTSATISTTELSANTLTSSSVPKRKPFGKGTNNSGGVAISVGSTEVSGRLSSTYSSGSTTQSQKLSKEKQNQVWDNNFNTNTSRNVGINTTKQNCNENENSAKLGAANTGAQQQTSIISKNQIRAVEKIAMKTTSLATSSLKSSSSSTSIKTTSLSTSTAAQSSPKTHHQEGKLEKSDDTAKQTLKALSNNSSNRESNKTATTTASSSSSSTTSTSSLTSQNSYTLDFLHSVGVKMTGVALRSPEMQRPKNNYGNSAVHNTYPYTGVSGNQRQPRYMYGGGSNTNNGNNGNQIQYYHHHHQPSQLTIASFLNKDLLGGDSTTPNANSSSSSRGGNSSSSTNSRNINNYQDRQQPPTQYTQHQQQNNIRYHHNYNSNSYQQQSGGMQHTNYSGRGGGGGGFSSGHRSSGYNYTNYHDNSGDQGMTTKNNTMTQLHQRQLKNNLASFKNSVNNSQVNKKSTFASSTTSSSGSLSSTKSFSSNSSNISNRHLQTIVNQDISTNSANLNLAIETLPSKMLNSGGGNPRINYRAHHHHHHSNQHLIMSSPNILQHQNYHNLTYVATDAKAISSGCSTPSQSLPPPKPLPTTNCNSPKTLEQSPNHAAILMNFNTSHFQYPRYQQHAQLLAAQQQQQFHKFQQQQTNILNKKVFIPLSINMPSPSSTPRPLSADSQKAVPQNIICCSHLDVTSTTATVAVASSSLSPSGIVAGNEYESDNSSNHSSMQIKYKSIQSVKSSVCSSSSSASSIPLKSQEIQQKMSVQMPTTTTCSPTVSMHSPMDFNYGGTEAQVFSNLELNQQTQMAQFYDHNNGHGGINTVISLPNLLTNSEEGCLQNERFSLSSTASNQKSPELFNITVANHSNANSGHWSPSFQNNQFIYHQFPTTQTAVLIPPVSSLSSSCGSSSASISPRLPNGDHPQHMLQNNGILVSGISPSYCSTSLNQQANHIIIGNGSNSDNGLVFAGGSSSSSNSSSSVSGVSNNGSGISINSTNGEENNSDKKGSTQLLTSQKNRLPAQNTCKSSSSSSVSSVSSSSASTLTSVVRTRKRVAIGRGEDNFIYINNNRCSSQLSASSQVSASSFVESSNSGSQNLTPISATQQYYSHYQSLPPPFAPHNPFYNNPQTHHIRALSALNNTSVHDIYYTPADRFLSRAHLVEAKEAPATLLNNSKWDHLSQDIWKKFINSQQTEETFKKKMLLWRYLYVFIKNAYPRYGLYLVGSTISGFGSDSSDVDMCLVSRSASSGDPRMEALINLNDLRECLSKSGLFENFNLIEAKVPILRFYHCTHQLEVDLNFNNCVGIKNTHLLYCYSQLDWRLRPLVLITKLWAQHHNINNAKNMTISSYSLVLMVIHFLQYAVTPPVLPCLHNIYPDKFPLLRTNDFGYVDMSETIGPYESKNTQTIGELFLMFLEYYSFFNYTENAISVRTGGVLPINECRVAKSIKNDIHQWKELCIEEPFDLTNTARSVYDFETFERVKTVFIESWRILQETLDLNSLFSTVLLPPPCFTENSGRNRNINSLISGGVSAFNDIYMPSDGKKINYQQYQAGEEYEESPFAYNNNDNCVVNVAADYMDEDHNYTVETNDSMASNVRTRRDLNRTLTPGQDFNVNELYFVSFPTSTSSTSIKTCATKIVNGNNNANSSNRTVSTMVS